MHSSIGVGASCGAGAPRQWRLGAGVDAPGGCLGRCVGWAPAHHGTTAATARGWGGWHAAARREEREEVRARRLEVGGGCGEERRGEERELAGSRSGVACGEERRGAGARDSRLGRRAGRSLREERYGGMREPWGRLVRGSGQRGEERIGTAGGF
ncbi:hypothetical protein GQ55_2G370300 [Panicum hallii var. hallii]|uniref:Uncharacterized protein n=1 Tax=Panicum hallii var. hallii TaxID=1504633 RepID=A0A2T7EWE2_9POAL|nr:hypothetical protein GQ55_2G370300 [Panicum hallii var. hallii]